MTAEPQADQQAGRYLGRFKKLPDLIPKSIATYQQPARKMREEAGILQPLDARNGG